MDEAIEECIQAGVVTSASCLVYRDRIHAIPECMRGKLGVHLRLTDGTPVLANSPLAGPDGQFVRHPLDLPTFTLDDVLEEWTAQVIRFRESGVSPTHLDSHHHVHAGFSGVYSWIAKRCEVAVVGFSPVMVQQFRASGLRCPDALYTGPLDLNDPQFQTMFDHGHHTVVMTAHPGRVDDELRRKSHLTDRRQRELEFLRSFAFKQWREREGVSLIGMAEL